jgi:NAD(P)-dependent dehydrogenase (short-subunit alcohol dehydrogenase family)
MEIDTVGTFATSRAAFPELKRSGGGSVVNISATLHYGATWWQANPDFLNPKNIQSPLHAALHRHTIL